MIITKRTGKNVKSEFKCTRDFRTGFKSAKKKLLKKNAGLPRRINIQVEMKI
jgi:hypothetical protein